jgi:hypothetical protein
VEAGALDLRADVRPCAAEAHSPALPAQAAGEHREVHHQGDVGKRELAHVHDDIALGAKRPGKRLPSPTLGGSVLVSATAQHGGLFAVVDDPGNLVNVAVARKE